MNGTGIVPMRAAKLTASAVVQDFVQEKRLKILDDFLDMVFVPFELSAINMFNILFNENPRKS